MSREAAQHLHLVSGEEASPVSSLLDQVEVMHERPGGLLEAMVPVELINREEVPVDEDKVQKLMESISELEEVHENGGQLTPVLLGEVPGENRFYIIDGFHRDASLERLGKQTYYATIKPNCTYEEIVDIRILTATIHTAVKFSRVIEWVDDAWGRSPWAERIKASQAFALSNNKKMNGKNMGLLPEEADEIRAWVAEKCEQWDLTAGAIYGHMSISQIADPRLIKEARERKTGRRLEHITPLHLKAIAKALPNRFEEQRLVAEIAKNNNFNLRNTSRILELFSATDTAEEARELAASTDWSQTRTSHEQADAQAREHEARAARKKELAFKRDFVVNELEVARLGLENLVLRGQYIAPPIDEMPTLPGINVEFDQKNEPAIARQVAVRSSSEVADAFVERVEEVEKTVTAALQRNAGQDELAARRAINNAAVRVSQDIEHGALRYVRLDSPRIFDTLLKACIQDELRRSKQDDRPESAKQLSEEHADRNVALESILDTLPELPSVVRRPFVLNSFFGVGSFTIAQVVRKDRRLIDNAVRSISDKMASQSTLRPAA